MNKTAIWAICTAIVMGLVVWTASRLVPFSYNEYSFFIGLGASILLFFFSSSGGVFSRAATMDASEAVWKVQKVEKSKVSVGGVFYGTVLYTVMSLILMIALYF
ncbi:hypothetical protein QU593_19210 [Rossellomorea marisflavi]|uniref:hypothetical protein n=1 Tax=Rossellomorea marisflavi TaxID=189381 RepID=UPI0025AF6CB0|nr:hypothetical protein [Rossellomorea marisflavi]WJV18236.1 hypothetical protein QU593_19210 [Rossellomorea marisflavi]